jgi:hypothetical protein
MYYVVNQHTGGSKTSSFASSSSFSSSCTCTGFLVIIKKILRGMRCHPRQYRYSSYSFASNAKSKLKSIVTILLTEKNQETGAGAGL